MSKHTTPLPHADQTGLEAAQPPRRASRFDERGIALQTVIIMVVLLTIAGAVAAVLLTRGGEAASQLEAQGISAVKAENIKSKALCENSNGLKWTTKCVYNAEADCNAHGGVKGVNTVDKAGGGKQVATECYAGNTDGAEHLGDIG